MRRLTTALLVALLVLFAVSVASADDTGLYACPAAPDVTHYRVYDVAADSTLLVADVPIASLVESAGLVGDAGGACPGVPLRGVVITTAPPNCEARTYTARFAIEVTPGNFEESGNSNAVTSIARPHVEMVHVAAGGIRQVVGENFIVGTTVAKVDGTPIATTFGSCQVLEIADTVTRTIVVTTPNGLLPFTFTIPLDAPSGAVAH